MALRAWRNRLFASVASAALLAQPAYAQSLPSPNFNGGSWANAIFSNPLTTGGTFTGGVISSMLVTPVGASVSYLLSQLFGQRSVTPDWFKQTADGTDDMPSIVRAQATGLPLRFLCRHYNIKSLAVFTTVLSWQGCGWQEIAYVFGSGNAAAQGDGWGTWLDTDASFQSSPTAGANAGAVPITITGYAASGSAIKGIGFTQPQTVPAPGVTSWSPAVYAQIIDINNVTAGAILQDLMFRGVYRGATSEYSGRTRYLGIYGQAFSNLLSLDNSTDVSRIVDVQHFPFWADNTVVEQYQQAHNNTIVMGRSDTTFISRIFSIYGLSGITFVQGAGNTGVSTGLQMDSIQCDFTQSCVYVAPSAFGVNFQADMIRSFGQYIDRGAYASIGISGTTMTVAFVTSNYIKVGQTVTCSGCAANTVVTALGTGTGNGGTYTVSISQTVPPGTTGVTVAPTSMITNSNAFQVDGSVYNVTIGSLDNFGSAQSTIYLSNTGSPSQLQVGSASVDNVQLSSANASFLLASSPTGGAHQVQMSSTPFIPGTKPSGYRYLSAGSTANLTAPTTAALSP